MKLRITLVGAAAVALAVPMVAGAAPAVTKVTGGGQTVTEAGGKDTIGFNAQTDGASTKGQVQFVDRGTDGSQTQYHGDVFCIQRVDDGDDETPVNAAIISGTWRKVNGRTTVADTGDYYTLYVEDNGEGAEAVSDQIVMNAHVHNTDDVQGPTCDNELDSSDDQPVLTHGNVQFHKGKAPKSKRSGRQKAAKTTAPKVVSLAGLR